jgi:hypothetical protein
MGRAARRWQLRRCINRWSAAMPQPNDLSRPLVALDQNSTIIAVIEMSQSSWMVAGVLPGIERQPRKKLGAEPRTAACSARLHPSGRRHAAVHKAGARSRLLDRTHPSPCRCPRAIPLSLARSSIASRTNFLPTAIDGIRPKSQVRTGLPAGGRWIRTSGSWSRDRQTVMEDGTAVLVL